MRTLNNKKQKNRPLYKSKNLLYGNINLNYNKGQVLFVNVTTDNITNAKNAVMNQQEISKR